MNIRLLNILASSDKKQILELLQSVFYDEQKLKEIEINLQDQKLHRIGIFNKKILIGYCQLREINNEIWKIERVCIHKKYRQNGYGHQLIKSAQYIALHNNADILMMYAQYQTQSFYEEMNFKKVSPLFDYMGKPHIMMLKHLKGRNNV